MVSSNSTAGRSSSSEGHATHRSPMRATTLRTQGKTNGDSSPTGYALRPGVPGSLVGDRGTATMTNFTTWALPLPAGDWVRDRDDVWRDMLRSPGDARSRPDAVVTEGQRSSEAGARARGRSGQRKLPSWRLEALKTTFWVMPTVLVLVAGLLFVVTFEIDWAAYHHHLHLPFWIESGSADAARQVLIAIAAAVITVVGVVFSITILALTLASQQFGPRMMRNFVRDVGNQVTLATFVATFVYSVLALVSITSIPHQPDFVPHLSVTVAEALLLVDLAVLIYFIHHIAKSIQLPEVIAGIARDLMRAIDAEFPAHGGATRTCRCLTGNEKSVPELLKLLDERGGTVTADSSGYLQFVGYAQLVAIASRTDAVIRLDHRPGHFVVAGGPLATVWPRGAAEQVKLALAKAHVTGPHRTLMQDPVFAIDQLVEIAIRALSPAVNDTFTALTCIDWLSAGLSRLSGRTLVEAFYRDGFGRVRLIESDPSYAKMVNRAFDKIRQAATGDARRDHPAAPRLGSRHGTDHLGPAAPILLRQADMIFQDGRGIGDRCKRPGGHSGPLSVPAHAVRGRNRGSEPLTAIAGRCTRSWPYGSSSISGPRQ